MVRLAFIDKSDKIYRQLYLNFDKTQILKNGKGVAMILLPPHLYKRYQAFCIKSGGQLRHPRDPESVGPFQPEDDHDLHPLRPSPDRQGAEEPARPGVTQISPLHKPSSSKDS
jgi:hypothetical protein